MGSWWPPFTDGLKQAGLGWAAGEEWYTPPAWHRPLNLLHAFINRLDPKGIGVCDCPKWVKWASLGTQPVCLMLFQWENEFQLLKSRFSKYQKYWFGNADKLPQLAWLGLRVTVWVFSCAVYWLST